MASYWTDPTPGALAGLAPDTRQLASLIVTACRDAGWPVIIDAGCAPGQACGGRRLPATQQRLVTEGHSKTLASKHVQGRAFDLDLFGYARHEGMPLWRHLGAWWKAAGLKWGGDWGDFGHFEM